MGFGWLRSGLRPGASDGGDLRGRNRRRVISPGRTHVVDYRSDVSIGNLRARRRHLPVVGFSANVDWTAEAVLHDVNDPRGVAGNDLVAGKRRKCTRRTLAVRLMTASAVCGIHFRA